MSNHKKSHPKPNTLPNKLEKWTEICKLCSNLTTEEKEFLCDGIRINSIVCNWRHIASNFHEIPQYFLCLIFVILDYENMETYKLCDFGENDSLFKQDCLRFRAVVDSLKTIPTNERTSIYMQKIQKNMD
jgi:hypothetical protein